MAGHSKWANIKHRKAKMDAKKGIIFSKLAKELTVAAKLGGGDLDTNIRLKTAVQRAKEANMPNESIQRAIQKGTGDIEGVSYDEINYEGYGPCGVAVFMKILTDNRNRTAGEIRRIFTKAGGSLGESGCVSWMFDTKGYICFDQEQCPMDGETLLLLAIEEGAEDVNIEDNLVEITTLPQNFDKLHNVLVSQGINNFSVSEITMLPQNTITLSDEKDAEQMLRLMDMLEDQDDIQAVYSNYEIPDEILKKLEQ